MKWQSAQAVVEELRRDTRLYLPALTLRRGFSSSRVEHLLNGLVKAMPKDECYLEVGTLEGRTLEAAAVGNDDKELVGCDPCDKYGIVPDGFPPNVTFIQGKWQDVIRVGLATRVGCVFYDGDHSAEETEDFMSRIEPYLADEAVLVMDDWDRVSVRDGAFAASARWQLLREMPEWTDGLTAPQNQFGYAHGIAVFGYRR